MDNIEKGLFLKLLNRGGNVLDFTVSDFDAFTMGSVGVQLCLKYQCSKGKALSAFISEASEEDAEKLLLDLLRYYENVYYDFKAECDAKINLLNTWGQRLIMESIIKNAKPLQIVFHRTIFRHSQPNQSRRSSRVNTLKSKLL